MSGSNLFQWFTLSILKMTESFNSCLVHLSLIVCWNILCPPFPPVFYHGELQLTIIFIINLSFNFLNFHYLDYKILWNKRNSWSQTPQNSSRFSDFFPTYDGQNDKSRNEFPHESIISILVHQYLSIFLLSSPLSSLRVFVFQGSKPWAAQGQQQ